METQTQSHVIQSYYNRNRLVIYAVWILNQEPAYDEEHFEALLI